MKTLEIGGIQIGKEIVNALDIGVISDGKTDCSGIINAFLSSKEMQIKHYSFLKVNTISRILSMLMKIFAVST